MYKNKKLIDDIYNLINHDTDKYTTSNIYDKKINILFNKKFMFPISDDFLRYNRSNFTLKIADNKDKENILVKKIINYINKSINYYNIDKNKSNNILYEPLHNRKVILYNDNEEIFVIQKIINFGYSNISSKEYYNKLIEYRYNSYFDFKSRGVFIDLKDQISSIRYSNFEYFKENQNNYIETKNYNDESKPNIIGLYFGCYHQKVKDCLNISDLDDLTILKKYISKNIRNLFNNIDNINAHTY
jgi:hypothetical protein